MKQVHPIFLNVSRLGGVKTGVYMVTQFTSYLCYPERQKDEQLGLYGRVKPQHFKNAESTITRIYFTTNKSLKHVISGFGLSGTLVNPKGPFSSSSSERLHRH